MSVIVTPPWDLCGFDRAYDPYSFDPEVWWRELLGLPISRERHIERVADPNGRDGEWPELAFMRHRSERVVCGGREMVVPVYESVLVAVITERVIREVEMAAVIIDEIEGRRR